MSSVNEASNLSTPSGLNYTCNECARSFQRREHLDRHRASHSKQRPYQCQTCNKSFTRRDTLRRHVTVHGQTPSGVKNLPRAVQACTSCMQSKQRCSGGSPCERCARRGWRCLFIEDPKKSRLQMTAPARDASATQSDQLSDYDAAGEKLRSEITSVGESTFSPTVPLIGGEGRDPIEQDSNSANPWEPAPTVRDDLSFDFDPMLLWPLAENGLDYAGKPAFQMQLSAVNMSFDGQHESNQELPDAPGMLLTASQFQNQEPNHRRNRLALEEKPHPELSEADLDILASEDSCQVPTISFSTYQQLCEMCDHVSRYSSLQLRGLLPSLDILNVFVQLYFEQFHKSFPVLHQPTFEPTSDSLLLYIAVASIGGQYSRISVRTAHITSLIRIMRHALLSKLGLGDSLLGDICLAQTILLFTFSLIFGGSRDDIMHAQYQRNLLTTICRPLLVRGILFEKNADLRPGSITNDWPRWTKIQSWKRVFYFHWVSECVQYVLFDIAPVLSVSDLTIDLPCDEDLWACRDGQEWKQRLDSKSSPRESVKVVKLLRNKSLRNDDLKPLGPSALLVATCAAYVEERALMKQFGGDPSHPILESLTGSIFEGLSKQTDDLLGLFPGVYSTHRATSPIVGNTTKLCHLFQIIRFIPYRVLYSSCGWLLGKPEADAFAEQISRKLDENSQKARQTLIHAAQLLHLVRIQQLPECFDSFFILMASLYIWFYDRFIVARKGGRVPSPTHLHTLRIDRDIAHGKLEDWVNGNDDEEKLIHISGIGVLNGAVSTSRILKEAINVLSHDGPWSVQSNAIARSLQGMLAGGLPSFED